MNYVRMSNRRFLSFKVGISNLVIYLGVKSFATNRKFQLNILKMIGHGV